ncbi:hypothetical protein MMC25_001530 [Agyrium rufum]|nr:hypothetical protein [Agyrium rufum]
MNHGYYPSDLPDEIPFPDQSHPIPQYYDPSLHLPDATPDLASANVARWFDQDVQAQNPSAKPNSRIRNRSTGEQQKHRRTRSGCYTCRQRRVKCGEERPTCERCRKGSRECVYPESTTSRKAGSGGAKLGQQRIPEEDEGSESSSDEYEDEEPDTPSTSQARGSSEKIRNPKSLKEHKAASRKQSKQALNHGRPGQGSFSPGQVKEKSMSPSTDDSGLQSRSTVFDRSGKSGSVSTATSADNPAWSKVRPDLQALLNYHQEHLNYHYYFFKHDASQFVHELLPEVALSYPPLLYALCGFAAYHQTVGRPGGKIPDFLQYYNEALALLRASLKAGEKHTPATMLTILQLAAFEEYLGDWVSLLSHQTFAKMILLELYTPANVMETETGRKILQWYARFDLFAGLMSGAQTGLGREWFKVSEEYYTRMAEENPKDVGYKIESNIAQHRVMAVEMALLFSKLPRGAISMEDFMTENKKISDYLQTWRANLDSHLLNPEHMVTQFKGDRDYDDIVDPYQPGGLFRGPLWTLNYMMIDWCAIDIMHKYQTCQLLQQPPPADLSRLALEQCRILEAIELWPESPPGAILPAQASLGIATLFLPKDDRHTMWCRRKLAKVESMGYIYPPTFRQKMADLWGIPDLNNWWLPNNEGYPAIVRNIRTFISERQSHPMASKTPKSSEAEDIRTIKSLFSKMNMLDHSPRTSNENSPENSGGMGQSPTPSDWSQQPKQQQQQVPIQHQQMVMGTDGGFGGMEGMMVQPQQQPMMMDAPMTGRGQQAMFGFGPQTSQMTAEYDGTIPDDGSSSSPYGNRYFSQ